MKVMVVGEFSIGALGRSFSDGFARCGARVEAVDYGEEYRRSPLARSRLTSRLLRRLYAAAMNRRIVERVRRGRPDLVLVVKGHWLHPRSLTGMRAHGARVFNYFPDSPFEKIRSNTSPWLRLTMPRYDMLFTFAGHLIPQFRQAGCQRVSYLPFASDPALHRPVAEGADLAPYRCDVSFVGNVDEARARWLAPLAAYDLKLWGVSYPASMLRDPKLRTKVQGRPLFGTDFAKAARASKISLNLMRNQNLGSHNMRTFEAPACRAFVLSQRTPEVTRLFAEDKEAAYFSSPEELRAKADYYLARPEDRARIAEAGWRRAQAETYACRAARILEAYWTMKEAG
jgi:spore maturation protein CgeB